jgi:hypothetical protein
MRPAIEEAGLKPIRADEVFSKPQITNEIWSQVRSCRVVLAELTGRNPNVLYELGLAHAIGKPSVIITRNENDVPFDLRALRYLYYDTDDPFWGDNLREQLTRMLKGATDSDNFDAVFTGITVEGADDRTRIYKPRPRRRQVLDISGDWQACVRFRHEREDTRWDLRISQTTNVLAGTLTASLEERGKVSVVQEVVAGQIDETHVSFHATAYTFIDPGGLTEWVLDSFNGTVTDQGQTITGTALDEDGSASVVILRRATSVAPPKGPDRTTDAAQ